MAATYEPIYGLSEDEVNPVPDAALLCRWQYNPTSGLGTQPKLTRLLAGSPANIGEAHGYIP